MQKYIASFCLVLLVVVATGCPKSGPALPADYEEMKAKVVANEKKEKEEVEAKAKAELDGLKAEVVACRRELSEAAKRPAPTSSSAPLDPMAQLGAGLRGDRSGIFQASLYVGGAADIKAKGDADARVVDANARRDAVGKKWADAMVVSTEGALRDAKARFATAEAEVNKLRKEIGLLQTAKAAAEAKFAEAERVRNLSPLGFRELASLKASQANAEREAKSLAQKIAEMNNVLSTAVRGLKDAKEAYETSRASEPVGSAAGPAVGPATECPPLVRTGRFGKRYSP